ncbi:uncharacterized protein ACNLHF_018936 [Anomaloglossus baeobatrachus]|uniref:uncharacterized protein LOC142311478 n=1 Tax=Anomaloglossus baeobatrachus TaxID=238106 RepID=UPI003F505150
MSEQGKENESSQYSALGPTHLIKAVPASHDMSLNVSTSDASHEAEDKPVSVNESAAVILVPDNEATDHFTAPSLPEQVSGVKMSPPAQEVSKRQHHEELPPVINVDNFQKVSSKDLGNAAPTADVEDLNDFLIDGTDAFHCDIEEETSAELESMSYPPAFDPHMRGLSDKPYGCKFCTRRFSHRSSLYRHQKSHSGEKLYKCSDCNKSFTNSSNLSVHSRIHTGEKPYECNGCGKKFTRKFALDQHVKIHKQDKLYICSHCGKSYSDYFFLLKHQQMYIPDSIMK